MNTILVTLEQSAKMSDRELMLYCFKNALAKLAAMPDGPEKQSQKRALLNGSVKRSSVEGVNSEATATEFFGSLGFSQLRVLRPGTKNPLFRFEVPPQYTAKSSIVRLKDLGIETKEYQIRKKYVHPYTIFVNTPIGTKPEFGWHAPGMGAMKVDSVTVIINETWDTMLEWFAGELPALWPATSDPGEQLVHLGVDKEAEHKYNLRKQNANSTQSS